MIEMRERIIDALREAPAPMDIRALCAKLGEPERSLKPELESLALEGRVAATKKSRWALPEALGLTLARIGFQRNGTPLAHPLNGDPAMPLIVEGGERCMPDDRVLVRPDGDRFALHTILRRGRTHLPAYVRIEHRQPRGAHRGEARDVATAVPCDVRIPYEIVLTGDWSFVKNDQIAQLKIERYPEYNRPITASVERVLGNAGSLHALMKAVAEDHGFATEPADAVTRAVAGLPEIVEPADMEGREDLRALLTFTIDNETAKDFDDAVSIEAIEGGWRLGVHIADVSHYVLPDSDIDADARLRGTSLYLPDLTVPMLPERLSNDLCSLMPDVDRLAMSLFMDIREGNITDHRLVRSVIHSHARLTYQAVNRLFEGGETGISPEIASALNDMKTLSAGLRQKRVARGAIDFEMDKPEFILDEKGEPEEILCQPRGEAERIIEDFMLVANETVAALARHTELPFIYRIHEDPDPDRLRALEAFLSGIGLHAHLGADPHPGKLQAVLERARAHPAGDVIRHYALRALKRARYCEQPLGHYALAMEDYCHFTSPIRRYPDLIVHRMLKLLLDGQTDRVSRMAKAMPELARDCSQCENAATLAERQCDGIMMAAYMSRQIGRSFDGVISGVTGWGLYVTLPNQVEGLVRISGLDDYYQYDAEHSRLVGEATGTVFKLGDRVRVRVESVVIPAGEVNFELRPPRKER